MKSPNHITLDVGQSARAGELVYVITAVDDEQVDVTIETFEAQIFCASATIARDRGQTSMPIEMLLKKVDSNLKPRGTQRIEKTRDHQPRLRVVDRRLSGEDLKSIRADLQLTTLQLGRALGLQGADATVSMSIRRYEADQRPIPLTTQRLALMLGALGGVPAGWINLAAKAEDKKEALNG